MQLGIFEASITPAVVLVVQMWYRRREQGYRMAGAVFFFSSFCRLLLMLVSLVFNLRLGECLRKSGHVRSWAHQVQRAISVSGCVFAPGDRDVPSRVNVVCAATCRLSECAYSK